MFRDIEEKRLGDNRFSRRRVKNPQRMEVERLSAKKYYRRVKMSEAEKYETMLESKRREHFNRKIKVLLHYSKGKLVCECCNEQHPYFLTLDHINGGGRKDGGSRSLYIKLINSGFPPGFRVLCINCNFAKGQFGFCPHEFYRERFLLENME